MLSGGFLLLNPVVSAVVLLDFERMRDYIVKVGSVSIMELTKVVTKGDIQAVAELAYEIWHECFAELLDIGQIDYMLDKFQSAPAIESQIIGGYEYYRVYDGGIESGYTAVKKEDGYLFMSKLYLKSSQRGKGLATQALAFIKERAKGLGLNKIRLTVNKYNKRAIKAYNKADFVTYAEQKADIGKGYFMDDYLMECKLS